MVIRGAPTVHSDPHYFELMEAKAEMEALLNKPKDCHDDEAHMLQVINNLIRLDTSFALVRFMAIRNVINRVRVRAADQALKISCLSLLAKWDSMENPRLACNFRYCKVLKADWDNSDKQAIRKPTDRRPPPTTVAKARTMGFYEHLVKERTRLFDYGWIRTSCEAPLGNSSGSS